MVANPASSLKEAVPVAGNGRAISPDAAAGSEREWPTWPVQGPPVTSRDWGTPKQRASLARSAGIVAGAFVVSRMLGLAARGRAGAAVRHIRGTRRIHFCIPHPGPALPGHHGRRVRLRLHPRLLRAARRRRGTPGLETRIRRPESLDPGSPGHLWPRLARRTRTGAPGRCT